MRIVWFLIGFMFVVGSFIYVHETSHYYIAESYGCNATINWKPEINKGLIKSSMASVSTECPESVREIHAISQDSVEAVGYQLTPMYGLIAIVTGLLLAFYME